MNHPAKGGAARAGLDIGARHAVPPSILGLVLFIAFAWGSSWPVMKLVMTEMAPMHYRLICLVIGSALLFAIARAGGENIRIPAGSRRRIVAIALANLGAWNILAAYGIPMIGAARASILCYTLPVWTALLGRWFLNERLTPRRVLGVSMGLAAAVLLLGNDIRAVGQSPLGAMMLIGAAIGWAGSLVMMRKWSIDLPTSSFTAWQGLVAVFPVGAIALFFEQGSFSPFGLSAGPFWGLLYSLFVFVFSNWAWTKIAVSVPPAVSSLSMLLNPVVAVFTSALAFDEHPQWADYAALALVVGAMATVMVPQKAQSGSA